MSPNTTLAPSATSVRTCEAPIPRAPPLISATFPANRSATAILLSCWFVSAPYVPEAMYRHSFSKAARHRLAVASGRPRPRPTQCAVTAGGSLNCLPRLKIDPKALFLVRPPENCEAGDQPADTPRQQYEECRPVFPAAGRFERDH